jgi:hypothetical protein
MLLLSLLITCIRFFVSAFDSFSCCCRQFIRLSCMIQNSYWKIALKVSKCAQASVTWVFVCMYMYQICQIRCSNTPTCLMKQFEDWDSLRSPPVFWLIIDQEHDGDQACAHRFVIYTCTSMHMIMNMCMYIYACRYTIFSIAIDRDCACFELIFAIDRINSFIYSNSGSGHHIDKGSVHVHM